MSDPAPSKAAVSLSVVLPAYDEEASIRHAVEHAVATASRRFDSSGV